MKDLKKLIEELKKEYRKQCDYYEYKEYCEELEKMYEELLLKDRKYK